MLTEVILIPRDERNRLRCPPDALFIRHYDADHDHAAALVNLLFLLTRSNVPICAAKRHASRLLQLAVRPPDEAAVPLWRSAAEALDWDLQAKLDARAKIRNSHLVAVRQAQETGELSYTMILEPYIVVARVS
jgi:hypothetical protein